MVGKLRFRLVIPRPNEVLGKVNDGIVIVGMLNDGKLVSKLIDGTLREGTEIDKDGKLIEGRLVSRLVEGRLIEGKVIDGRLKLGSETDRSVGTLSESDGKLIDGTETERSAGRLKDTDGKLKEGSEKLVDGTLSVGIAGSDIEGEGSANDALDRESERSVGKLRLRLGMLSVGKLTERSVGRLMLTPGNVSDGIERLADGKAVGILGSETFVGSVSAVGSETLGVETVRPGSPSVKLSSNPVVKRVTVTAGGTNVTVTASQISALVISNHDHFTVYATGTRHSK